MAKLIGLNKIKTAVFISGTGSNLKNLINFSKTKKSPISIDLIISNTIKAKGLKFANQYQIKKKKINIKKKKTTEKKLFILSSPATINKPEYQINTAIIMPVRVSIIGVARTKMKQIFFALSLKLLI